LELAEAKIQSSEAKLALLNAQAAVLVARTEMSEVLGVRASQNWQIAKQLPIPNTANRYSTGDASGKIPAKDTLVQQALEQRLDLQAAQTKIAALTLKLKSHGLENKVGDIELGAERERESDGERLTGPNVEWAVPLFSQGQEDQLKINAELEIAQAQLRQLVLKLDNGIALALAGRENSSNKIIQYQNHLLPAQANAVARTQEEQFFMLIGVFEVLQSKKHQYESLLGLVDAVEEYWLATTALAKAVGVSPKVFIDQSNNGSQGLEDYLQPDPGTDSSKKSHKHQHHGMHNPHPRAATPTHANHNQAPDNHASHKNHTQSASAKP
jgi:cobalt-zinc-cadmium efflux system outer membrane protein